MLTAYHAKYFAHELTKHCPSDSIEKLASALVDAQVDLNPHQIEAALRILGIDLDGILPPLIRCGRSMLTSLNKPYGAVCSYVAS